MTGTGSLRDYFLLEARHTPRRAPIAAAIFGALAVLGTHMLLVRFPERAIRFLEDAFHIQGMAAVLLVNDLIAVYFTAFFVGLAGLLGALVIAREEDRLELLLAKPIRARVLLAARVLPVLGAAAASGIVVAVVTALAVVPHLAPGDMVTFAGALGGTLFLTALAVVLLSALLPLLVRMRDSFHALLVGALVWLVPAMPAAVFIYRPDLFEGHDTLRSTIVMSTLVWHDATAAWLGPVALTIAMPLCALFVALAGRVLESTDTR
ncbi:hypothetical protein [Polyangium aurulentum]|uniref:hypothetical protein n=1 Tax=Polyangium aurulentum TaxID=2567896 RepID=UPI0010AE5C78|nr:hypothetical protein [Polyangium aurulentum]UQA57977.1 hypothetical protein E8A73_043030 [Polyangium aurulentum]